MSVGHHWLARAPSDCTPYQTGPWSADPHFTSPHTPTTIDPLTGTIIVLAGGSQLVCSRAREVVASCLRSLNVEEDTSAVKVRDWGAGALLLRLPARPRCQCLPPRRPRCPAPQPPRHLPQLLCPLLPQHLRRLMRRRPRLRPPCRRRWASGGCPVINACSPTACAPRCSSNTCFRAQRPAAITGLSNLATLQCQSS